MKDRIYNLFTGEESGEIMVVHQCSGCGVISANRIAGDDNPYLVTELLLDTPTQIGKIVLLSKADNSLVVKTLFGASNY